MDNHELEQPPIDYTLLGQRVEDFINAVVPTWFINWWKKGGCGCEKRKEWLNNKNLDYREWRISRAETNYKIAKDKLDRLMHKYYDASM